MVFDATGNTIINDAASLSAHDVILSSGRISMGSVTTGLSGLTLTNSILQQVSNAASLNLRSYKSIDFYGSFALGGALNTERPTIGNLTLDTAGIGGYNATGGGAVDATIRANSVTLINSNGVTGSPFATTAPMRRMLALTVSPCSTGTAGAGGGARG